jgi:hypothetical protein
MKAFVIGLAAACSVLAFAGCYDEGYHDHHYYSHGYHRSAYYGRPSYHDDYYYRTRRPVYVHTTRAYPYSHGYYGRPYYYGSRPYYYGPHATITVHP